MMSRKRLLLYILWCAPLCLAIWSYAFFVHDMDRADYFFISMIPNLGLYVVCEYLVMKSDS